MGSSLMVVGSTRMPRYCCTAGVRVVGTSHGFGTSHGGARWRRSRLAAEHAAVRPLEAEMDARAALVRAERNAPGLTPFHVAAERGHIAVCIRTLDESHPEQRNGRGVCGVKHLQPENPW